MADEDLSKLKIDKTAAAFQPGRRKKRVYWISALVLIGILFAGYRYFFNPPLEVEVAAVSQAYHSQAFTLLNASGYVVAQRKAAVASKTTGRLEWLGVEEGSRVKSGQIIARLEGKDAEAAKDQASANVNNTRAAL